MKLTSRRSAFGLVVLSVGAALLAGCGGGGDPLTNPSTVTNPVATGAGASGSNLSFAYFQKCVEPIFLKQLTITQNGVTSTNTCSGAGCHDSNTGKGGALRVIVAAPAASLPTSYAASGEPANADDVTALHAADMYKNFYSAQGVTIPGSPLQSRLIEKPLLLNVLHGGGQVFAGLDDPNVKVISYWISHPMPNGQSELNSSASTMFTPQPDLTQTDPLANVTCNTQ